MIQNGSAVDHVAAKGSEVDHLAASRSDVEQDAASRSAVDQRAASRITRPVASVVDVALAAALGLAALRLYARSAPAVVNPDGLGYLKQMSHNYAAGHLLYLPLFRAVT